MPRTIRTDLGCFGGPLGRELLRVTEPRPSTTSASCCTATLPAYEALSRAFMDLRLIEAQHDTAARNNVHDLVDCRPLRWRGFAGRDESFDRCRRRQRSPKQNYRLSVLQMLHSRAWNSCRALLTASIPFSAMLQWK